MFFEHDNDLNRLRKEILRSPSPSQQDQRLALDLLAFAEGERAHFDEMETQNLLRRVMLAWITRKLPRYFTENGRLSSDKMSHRWSPDYYRLESGLQLLWSKLYGKRILDPFAGPGSLSSNLTALGIPRSVMCGDISYFGGKSLAENPRMYHTHTHYHPQYNVQEYENFFARYADIVNPPDFSVLRGYITLHAAQLPFEDRAFDYVVSDPPYGFQLREGGSSFFVSCVEEMARVVREGMIFLLPMAWLDTLSRELQRSCTQLTGDLTDGSAAIPACFVEISP